MLSETFTWLPAAYLASEWAIRVLMTPIVVARRPAAIALTWLAIIYFLPWIGLILYGMIGQRLLGRLRLKRRREARRALRDLGHVVSAHDQHSTSSNAPEQDDLVLLTERLSGMPLIGGNTVSFVTDSDAAIDSLIKDIDAAENHAHLLFFVFKPDSTGLRVCEALKRAAARGVTCRVLADGVGSKPFFGSASRDLRRAGVDVREALPAGFLRRRMRRIDLRNHRKLAVIDGAVAHTGSQNIVNADYGTKRSGPWRDIMMRVVGPAVAGWQTVFIEDWHSETDDALADEPLFPSLSPAGPTAVQIIPSGPDDEGNSFHSVIIASLFEAQHRVIITTPYFIPDDSVVLALKLCVLRGVRVDLVLPKRCDHILAGAAAAARYTDLLDAGVRIHLHSDGLLHAKTLCVDDAFAIVGSGNLDSRSFFLNFELSAILYGAEVAGRLRAEQERYISESDPLTKDAWRRQPGWKQVARSTAALAGPLL